MLFNQIFLETCQFQCFSNFSSTSYLQLNSLLERTVRRLDEDARRTGRISMKEIQEALREIQQSSEFSNFELLTYLFSSMSNSTICPGSTLMFNCVSGEVKETRPYGFHPCSILQHVTYGLI